MDSFLCSPILELPCLPNSKFMYESVKFIIPADNRDKERIALSPFLGLDSGFLLQVYFAF